MVQQEKPVNIKTIKNIIKVSYFACVRFKMQPNTVGDKMLPFARKAKANDCKLDDNEWKIK